MTRNIYLFFVWFIRRIQIFILDAKYLVLRGLGEVRMIGADILCAKCIYKSSPELQF